jgi:transposase-like protein
LQDQGLKTAPELAIGDGALGFWKALSHAFPTTRVQRYWVHKTVNVLNNLPKSQQPKAKAALHEIYMAETKDEAQMVNMDQDICREQRNLSAPV